MASLTSKGHTEKFEKFEFLLNSISAQLNNISTQLNTSKTQVDANLDLLQKCVDSGIKYFIVSNNSVQIIRDEPAQTNLKPKSTISTTNLSSKADLNGSSFCGAIRLNSKTGLVKNIKHPINSKTKTRKNTAQSQSKVKNTGQKDVSNNGNTGENTVSSIFAGHQLGLNQLKSLEVHHAVSGASITHLEPKPPEFSCDDRPRKYSNNQIQALLLALYEVIAKFN